MSAQEPGRSGPGDVSDRATGGATGEGADAERPASVSSSPVVEGEPEVAARLFGDRIELARSYTAELARRGEELGLIGPRELPQLWTRHVLNSAVLAPLVRTGRVGDVGSGAGLPGLILAIARPDARLVLVEPMERRVHWLESEVARLGLDNVEVVRARAEDVRPLHSFDQVTARAVSALSKLVPITAPLVKDGGELLFLKGARVGEELAAAQKQLRRAGVEDAEVLVLGDGILPETTRVFRARVRGR